MRSVGKRISPNTLCHLGLRGPFAFAALVPKWGKKKKTQHLQRRRRRRRNRRQNRKMKRKKTSSIYFVLASMTVQQQEQHQHISSSSSSGGGGSRFFCLVKKKAPKKRPSTSWKKVDTYKSCPSSVTPELFFFSSLPTLLPSSPPSLPFPPPREVAKKGRRIGHFAGEGRRRMPFFF